MGVLIDEQEGLDFFKELFKSRRVAYNSHDSDSHGINCRCIPKSFYKNLPYISKDREKETGETLDPFYLEIVPKFSSIQTSNSEN